ncbi:hypothetical protein H0H92_013615 [Tricholoma furcatifolium]|nr:hypothetical protein H0H92_013615 [Tricholoma furcatifolium]
MHQHHQGLHPSTESPDAYYLVPDKYGGGKSLVRRPRPPPSTIAPPLDDDFDAATTTRGGRSEWDGPTHRVERPKSPSPSEASPQQTRATITRVSKPATSRAPTPKAQPSIPTPSAPIPIPPRKDHAPPVLTEAQELREAYGDYARYIAEIERKFGGSPDRSNSPTRRRKDPGPSSPPPKTGATSANDEYTGNSKIGYPARLGSIGRPGNSHGQAASAMTASPGLRARHSLEIIDRRVLEDGPERTVTISTWREQVRDEADQRANMEVYYLDARDFQAEGAEADGGDREEARESPWLQMRSLPAPPPLSVHEESVSDPGSIRTITDEQSSGTTSIKRTPPATSITMTPKSDHSRLQHGHSRSSGSGSQPGHWHPTPPQTPPRQVPSRSLHAPQPTYRALETVMSSNSSPSRSAATPPLDHVHAYSQLQHTPRSSTPNKMNVRQSQVSFHPTQSGSTISTIKSAESLALERILDSCEPSLLHVGPALARLGILNDGHLRAISRLSDETRDRELKDAVLKQGITVMEWAILLDKLQTL